jgi:AGCS family alanine or glycine:cation symporter
MMILGMAFPNLVGVVLLSGRVKRELDRYLGKLQAGEFTRYSAQHIADTG